MPLTLEQESRRQYKTMRLLMGLRDDTWVMVPTEARAKETRCLIAKYRPDVKNVKVVVASGITGKTGRIEFARNIEQ